MLNNSWQETAMNRRGEARWGATVRGGLLGLLCAQPTSRATRKGGVHRWRSRDSDLGKARMNGGMVIRSGREGIYR